MTPKERALKVIRELPDDVSFEEMLEELYFLDKIERGLADEQAERVVSHKEAKKRLARWLK